MYNINDITVIIPVYNEEKHIKKALECIINQTWQGFIEIVIVDNESTDKTLLYINEVKEGLPKNRFIKVLTNSIKSIPKSLNIACNAATCDIIIRIDGHTYAPLDYVEECIDALRKIDFKGVVGGRWIIKPNEDNTLAKAIAIGVTNKVGIGNAAYRNPKLDHEMLLDVDTVPFGSYTKDLWKELEGYDENLPFDEDYDFNFRAMKKGYKVVLNPKIVLDYYSRENLNKLGTQYYKYGFWATKFCIKHKTIPSVRRLIPLTFMVSLILTPFINMLLFKFIIILYLLVISITAFYEGLIKRKSISLSINLIAVFISLHFSYGIGSLASFCDEISKKLRRKK